MLKLLSLAVLLFAAFAVVGAQIEEDDGVLVLTSENFDAAIAAHDPILVEFYAPWCGHCKRLAPEYSKAAASLAAAGSSVKLAKVDADEHGELGQRFGVRGFPTLKWFVSGEPVEYNGPREAAGIVDWITKATTNELPALGEGERDSLFAEQKDEPVVIVIGGDAQGELYQEALAAYRSTEGPRFYFVASSEEQHAIIERSFDEAHAVDGSIADAIALHGYGAVVEFSPTHIARFQSQGKKYLIVAVAPDIDGSNVVEVLQGAADKAEELGFALTYAAFAGQLQRAVTSSGASGTVFPTAIAVAIDGTGGLSTVWHEDHEFNAESFIAWLPKLVDGTYEVFKKSEPLPESNDGPVTVMVAKNFDEVMSSAKYVFVEYYAPWCGHCKALQPVWEQLGEAFANNNDVVIAKLDATANFIEAEVRGYPTLFFYVNGVAQKYEGGRDLAALESFVNEHVDNHSHDEL